MAKWATGPFLGGWQPIETAPKDGNVILAYCPVAVALDEHVWTWPEDAALNILPVIWGGTDETRSCHSPGWYAPFHHVSFGVWDDPSTDFYQIQVTPTHWMPLPEPPK